MKISYNWLKWYIPDAPSAEKLHDILTYHLTEVESFEKKEIKGETDCVFDINILPNRAHDLLSHQGVARELAGQLGIKFNDPTEMYKIPESIDTKLEVKIESENCRRYMARIIRNVKVGPSPEWMVKHLESIGERSINNIVDATNIVMYDCGQPCHAYDLRQVESLPAGKAGSEDKAVSLKIQNTKENKELKLVGRDEIIAKLESGDIVIKNEDDKILALAGIKGGVDSGISDGTTDIVLEVANFEPTSIRRTARRLGLLSDSAKRFENDLSPHHTAYAIRELSALFLDKDMHCEGAVFEDIVDVYPKKQVENKISFTSSFVNKKLGSDISDSEIETILKNYKFDYKFNEGVFTVTVPKLRLDLKNKEDMIEEIGRIYGYDKLVHVLPKISSNILSLNKEYEKTRIARSHFFNTGFREVMTYTFTDKGDVEVAKSASDKNFLRTNLSDGLKKSYEVNKLNAPLLGLDSKNVKIFEIGSVFIKNEGELTHVAFIDKSGLKEVKLEEFVKSISNTTDYLLPQNEKFFKPWSPYPFITRDMSLWVKEDSDSDIVLDIIKKEGEEFLVIEPHIVDRFEKPGQISFAFRMVFQSNSKTLTDDEVGKIIESITKKLEKKGYILR